MQTSVHKHCPLLRAKAKVESNFTFHGKGKRFVVQEKLRQPINLMHEKRTKNKQKRWSRITYYFNI
jgi:hypothetical protein